MKPFFFKLSLAIAAFTVHQYSSAQPNTSVTENQNAPVATVPAGFKATIIADSLPGARHLVVNKKGGVYVKLSKLRDGKGIVYLTDTDGDGKFTVQNAFGDYPGTGICIKNDYLYASSNSEVFRYKLDNNGEVIEPNAPEKIVTGLVD